MHAKVIGWLVFLQSKQAPAAPTILLQARIRQCLHLQLLHLLVRCGSLLLEQLELPLLQQMTQLQHRRWMVDQVLHVVHWMDGAAHIAHWWSEG